MARGFVAVWQGWKFLLPAAAEVHHARRNFLRFAIFLISF